MEQSEKSKALQDIESILNEERQVLLTGQLMALSEIGERKSALADAYGEIEEADSSADHQSALARVRTLAERNSELMSEASQALRGSLQRMKELQKIAAGEDTYQSDGSRRFDPELSATLRRRA